MNDTTKWALETMEAINKLTPDIEGKAFDPGWALLRNRIEEREAMLHEALADLKNILKVWDHNCGRFIESMGSENPRLEALEKAIEDSRRV